MSDLGRIIQDMLARRTNLKAKDVDSILESIGFTVRLTGNGGHRVFHHAGLDGFHGSNYDGGHGSNPTMKPRYIEKIVKILRDYKDQLAPAPVPQSPESGESHDCV